MAESSPELLAFYGFIDAEEYLRLTDAPYTEVSAENRQKIVEAQHKRWAKHREKMNAN